MADGAFFSVLLGGSTTEVLAIGNLCLVHEPQSRWRHEGSSQVSPPRDSESCQRTLEVTAQRLNISLFEADEIQRAADWILRTAQHTYDASQPRDWSSSVLQLNKTHQLRALITEQLSQVVFFFSSFFSHIHTSMIYGH